VTAAEGVGSLDDIDLGATSATGGGPARSKEEQ
jgi:hypothetical protein